MWYQWSVLFAVVTWLAAAQETLRAECRNSNLCQYLGVSYGGEQMFNVTDGVHSSSLTLGWWKETGALLVQCAGEASPTAAAWPVILGELVLRRLVLRACPAPPHSYADLLKALGLPVPPSLVISIYANNETVLTARHFRGLENVTTLELEAPAAAKVQIAINALQSLSLEMLTVSGVAVRDVRLPSSLRRLSLTGSDVRVVEAWDSLDWVQVSSKQPLAASLGGLELSTLWVSGAPLSLVESQCSAKLTKLSLINATDNIKWPRCEKLEKFELANSNLVRSLPEKGLAGLADLQKVSLERLASLVLLPENLIWNSTALRQLSVRYCSLVELPPLLLRDAAALDELNLDSNRIQSIPESFLNGASSLSKLYLRDNRLKSLSAVSQVAGLRRLAADRNPLGEQCGPDSGGDAGGTGLSPLYKLTQLQQLSLSETGLSRLCVDWRLRLLRLQHLDLSGNNVTTLQRADLDWFRVAEASVGSPSVDLTANPLQSIQYLPEDYRQALQENQTAQSAPLVVVQIQIDMAKLDCGCEMYWYLLAVESDIAPPARVSLPPLPCRPKLPLIECSVPECEPNCTCSVRPAEPAVSRLSCRQLSSTVVERRGPLALTMEGLGLKTVPKMAAELVELRIPNNHIENIDDLNLNYTKVLDVRNNSLRSLGGLLARCDGTMLVRGNPLRCDCGAAALLREHPACVVEDWSCSPECSGARWGYLEGGVTLTACCVLGVGGLLLLARYRHRLKAVLHARGFGPAPQDPPCKYDVFVSYAHEDSTWVVDTLQPVLERRWGLRVCVHYRDWPAGEWIASQIARSVAESRRTLAVVTPSYVASQWARAELHAALSQPSGRVPRLVLVLLQPVPADELKQEPVLDAYLANNTYATPDDPWFWDKLRCALPRPTPSPPVVS